MEVTFVLKDKNHRTEEEITTKLPRPRETKKAKNVKIEQIIAALNSPILPIDKKTSLCAALKNPKQLKISEYAENWRIIVTVTNYFWKGKGRT